MGLRDQNNGTKIGINGSRIYHVTTLKLGTPFLHLLLETGLPFYVVIRATRSLGLSACCAKRVPSFLSYFKTLIIGPAPGIQAVTFRPAVKRSTD